MRRIGDEHEATVKPIGGHIIFIPKGGGKSATGKVLGTTLLTPKDVINWKVNFNIRSKYGLVIAKWYSYERGETIEEKVGNEEPSYPIYKLYPTAESVISAASAKLRRLKRGEAKLNMIIPGNPELFAEDKKNLSGFCQEIDVQTAGKQGDEFRETLEEIGIDIEELAENIKRNPQKALLDFFEILKK